MYATLTQVKTYLAISSNSDDALLQELIVRASAIIDLLTQTRFRVDADETRTFGADAIERWRGREILWFPPRLYLATAATTVIAGDGSLIPPSQISYPHAGPPYAELILVPQATFAAHAGIITVIGRWGWSVTPPADIVHACIRLAAYAYQQRASQADVDRPVVADGGLVVLPTKLPADVRALLARYAPIL